MSQTELAEELTDALRARKLRTGRNVTFCEVSRTVASVNPGSGSSF
ncbi:hypothetical protein QUB11_03695 [Microcoleus sp. B6-A1]